jgi:uncharacterized protein YjiS (DUF1127 family)
MLHRSDFRPETDNPMSANVTHGEDLMSFLQSAYHLIDPCRNCILHMQKEQLVSPHCPDYLRLRKRHIEPSRRRKINMAVIDTTRPYGASGNIFARATLKLVAAVSAWNDARATRKALSQLSDRELEDIGLTRGDIDRVAG